MIDLTSDQWFFVVWFLGLTMLMVGSYFWMERYRKKSDELWKELMDGLIDSWRENRNEELQ